MYSNDVGQRRKVGDEQEAKALGPTLGDRRVLRPVPGAAPAARPVADGEHYGDANRHRLIQLLATAPAVCNCVVCSSRRMICVANAPAIRTVAVAATAVACAWATPVTRVCSGAEVACTAALVAVAVCPITSGVEWCKVEWSN